MVGCSNSCPDRPNLTVFKQVTIAPLPKSRQHAVMSKIISSEQKSKFASIHQNGDASVSKKNCRERRKTKHKLNMYDAQREINTLHL